MSFCLTCEFHSSSIFDFPRGEREIYVDFEAPNLALRPSCSSWSWWSSSSSSFPSILFAESASLLSAHWLPSDHSSSLSWWGCCSVQPDRWKKWRLVSHFEMHFRDLAPSAVNVTCLKNWITSKNHSGVNIRPSWPRSDSRAAVGDVKAPPATLGTLWEPSGNPLGTLWGNSFDQYKFRFYIYWYVYMSAFNRYKTCR